VLGGRVLDAHHACGSRTATVLGVRSPAERQRLPGAAWRLALTLGLASTADWYLLFAVFWIAAERGWTGGQIAVLVIAARAPTLLGGVLGGRAVDAFGARAALLVDGATRGVVSALFVLAQLTHHDDYPVIVALGAASAVFSPLSYAASRTLMPRLVNDAQAGRANSLLSLGDQGPIILGAALAGPALIWLGAAAFVVPTALMLAAGVVAWSLRDVPARSRPLPVVPAPEPMSSVWRSAPVVALVALSTVYFFVYGPFQPLLPVLVEENLGGGAGTFALLRIMLGLGSLVGLLLAPWLCSLDRPGVVNAAGAVVYGLVLFPLMLVHSTVAAVVVYTLSGVVWGPYAAVEATALQRWTDSRHHGRVFGTQRALVITAIPLGGALGSLALDQVSVSTVLEVSAAACTLTGVVALLVPAIRTSSSDDRDRILR
jgi:predicted MFS family arabinose efflux permease